MALGRPRVLVDSEFALPGREIARVPVGPAHKRHRPRRLPSPANPGGSVEPGALQSKVALLGLILHKDEVLACPKSRGRDTRVVRD